MSLINEALKKAQRQRSLDAAPLSSAPSGVAAAAVTTHVRAASHRRSYAPVWFGLGLLVLGAGATVVIMRYGIDSGTPAAPVPVAAQPAPVALVATPVVATPLPAPAAPTSEVAVVLPPIASAPAAIAATPPPLAPTTNAPAPAPKPAPAPATSAPALAPVAVQPAPASAPTDSERAALVYSFLDTARLTGVRGTGTSARVLMNERVYRLNDIVNAALGLRLSAVRPGLMVFTDAQGKTYEKPY